MGVVELIQVVSVAKLESGRKKCPPQLGRAMALCAMGWYEPPKYSHGSGFSGSVEPPSNGLWPPLPLLSREGSAGQCVELYKAGTAEMTLSSLQW